LHWQLLAAQVAFAPQSFVQLPQCAGSVARSTQEPEQLVGVGLTQLGTQPPAWQSGVPPEQVPAHEPQCVGSLLVLASQPSSVEPGIGPLQSAKGAVHVWVHRPAAQLRALLFMMEHASPQPPQWAASVAVSVSQPSSMEPGCGPLQSAKVPVHV
jgi:hypothetical protein